MERTFTKEQLVGWVKNCLSLAVDDKNPGTSAFPGTIAADFSIVAGWQPGFDPEYMDVFACSKADPTKVMCIKIVKNPGFKSVTQFAFRDFGLFELPTDTGLEDNTCVPLEWDDNPEVVADFYLHEWERITARQEVLAS